MEFDKSLFSASFFYSSLNRIIKGIRRLFLLSDAGILSFRSRYCKYKAQENPLPVKAEGLDRREIYSSPPIFTNSGANTSETTVISLIKMFSDGPEVSLKGSPTVSPTTAALCCSEPLPP